MRTGLIERFRVVALRRTDAHRKIVRTDRDGIKSFDGKKRVEVL